MHENKDKSERIHYKNNNEGLCAGNHYNFNNCLNNFPILLSVIDSLISKKNWLYEILFSDLMKIENYAN